MGRNPNRETVFRMKRFEVINRESAMKPGTDGVLLGAWGSADVARRIIDVGTGTGLIALMMAQRYAEAEITAVEIDERAASEAALNFSNSPWSDRLSVVTGDFAEFQTDRKFDLIVSNPPFFKTGLMSPSASRAIARHENSLPFPTLFSKADSMLSDNGTLALITPAEYRDDLIFQAAMARLYPRRICEVRSVEGKAPFRIMWEFKKYDGVTINEVLTIRSRADEFTPDYRQLTAEFYLQF